MKMFVEKLRLLGKALWGHESYESPENIVLDHFLVGTSVSLLVIFITLISLVVCGVIK